MIEDIDDGLASLVKARSMLVILLATCETTQLALDAAGNILDSEMTEDLRRMIDRTKGELAVLDQQIALLRD